MSLLKTIFKLDENAGISQEQGRFWNPALLNREILPLRGSPPGYGPPARAKETTLSSVSKETLLPSFERTRVVTKVLQAVLEGNKRRGVYKSGFTIFPMSASEAKNPQKVKSPKK